MTKPLNRQSLSFVLRVWVEFLDHDPSELRWEIENVENREKVYFLSMDDIHTFIKRSAKQKYWNEEIKDRK